MQNPTIKSIGEFGFIEFIKRYSQNRQDIVVGIGDDVAVLDTGSAYILATCDAQINGIHFISEKMPPRDTGRRLVAVNASDIAAMGGEPKWALMGLNVPEYTELAYLEELYKGIREALDGIGAELVGGNCARTIKDMVFDMFLVGMVEKDHLVTRSGARTGDFLVVSGTLGKARAGLALVFQDNAQLIPETVSSEKDVAGSPPNIHENAIRSYFTPVPRIELGRFLGKSQLVHAMIDISDGLIQDAEHICRASCVDVVIDVETIPIDEACTVVATAIGANALEWAMTGGEDYELLFATDPYGFEKILSNYSEKPELNFIGRFREGSGIVWLKWPDGKETPARALKHIGWSHF